MTPPTYLREFPDQIVIDLNYERAVEAIGKVCVEFQRLETLLKVAIGDLVDPPDHRLGMIVTAQLSFKAILDLFGALFEHRFNDPAQQKKLRKFLDRCKAAEDRRNQVIHSHWEPDSYGGQGAVRRKSTARGKLKTEQQILSQADLQDQANELAALRGIFSKDWMPSVHGYMTARLPKSRYLEAIQKQKSTK
jgi:hypothetical protein